MNYQVVYHAEKIDSINQANKKWLLSCWNTWSYQALAAYVIKMK